MAPLALLLSLILIAWLLVRDCRRRTSVSAAIWIPTLFLLIVGSRPVSLWLGGGVVRGTMGNDAERSPLDQVFYLSIIVGSWIIASSRRVNWHKLLTANTALIPLYLFFAISVLWSGDPVGSSKRLFKDFGMLFVISAILSEKDPLEAIRAVYVRCACVLFPLSVVFIRYFPTIARYYSIAGEEMLTGVTTQKNTLGEIILVFSLFLIWECLERRSAGGRRMSRQIPWDCLALLLMAAWLLYMSQSKTALICLLIGVGLVARKGWLASRMTSGIVLLAALSAPVLMFFEQRFSSTIAPLVEAVGRDTTFTGRTNIWEHITFTTVNAFVGAGYWNFWGGKGGLAISQAMGTTVPNAHCGYLDIFLDGGVIGLALLLCLLVASGRRLIASFHVNRYQQVQFAVLIVMILYNLTESTFFRLSPTWFTTLLVIIVFPSLKTRVRKSQASLAEDSDGIQLSTAHVPQYVNQWRHQRCPSPSRQSI